jgi:hypothetical protein
LIFIPKHLKIMKTLKLSIVSLGIAMSLFGCHSKERAALRQKVDSLNHELQASQKAEGTLHEVAVLIDSIDANRRSLNTKMIEGTSYADYVTRLKDISENIRATQQKLDQLQASSQNSQRISAATIQRLKTDLELRSKDILALQAEVADMREQNKSLSMNVSEKDSMLTVREQTLQVKEGDITSLQGLVKDMDEQNKIKVADLYFAQAQALETAAHRTRFAPRRKKETRREALELYKLSLSLGKSEAQARITELEKEV